MPPTLSAGARGGEPLISIRDLKVHFDLGGGGAWDRLVGGSPVRRVVKAVDGVSLDIYPGETLGLVGESGCGKSTTARLVLKLLDATSGQVMFDGQDITRLSRRAMRPIRREMQMILQDPYASLNPRHPYTRALLRSIPKLGKKSHQRLESIKGMVPDPYHIPPGCPFHPRCPRYIPEVCAEPVYVEVGPNHRVLCNRAGEPWS